MNFSNGFYKRLARKLKIANPGDSGQDSANNSPNETPCAYCEGKGEMYGKRCPICQGSGQDPYANKLEQIDHKPWI
jgi:RecJ-like exonuclease